MSSAPWTFVAGVALALGAAASFGTSAMLQQRTSHQVPEEAPGRPQLLTHLIRLPAWRWSVVLAAVGFSFQVAALHQSPLILVQPLLITGLLWYVLLSAAIDRHPPDRLIIIGSLLCLAGLSMFLVLARPTAGDRRGLNNLWTVLPLGVGLAGTVVACLLLATTVGRAWRALPLALAAGVVYGVTAGLVRSLTVYFSAGLGEILQHWQTYAICVLGPFGVLLNQNAYQAGRLGSPALAIITVTDPLTSLLVGALWLGESIVTQPAALAFEMVGLVILTGGVWLVAHRAPQVAAEEDAERARQTGGSAANTPARPTSDPQ